MTLLDIGCGWGATMLRAIEKYDVNVVGLTLSKNQQEYVRDLFDKSPSPRTMRVLLMGWEQFDGQVDRIVSIGAFEHFGHERYEDFFTMAYRALPPDGVMLLHTITGKDVGKAKELGLALTFSLARFVKFIMTEIFPGGRLPTIEMVEQHATKGGFEVTRIQPLRPHYVKTLDTWAAALQAHREDAIEIQSEKVYDRYMRYLTGAANLFRDGYTDVCQFTLQRKSFTAS
jgi:cyclopropane-fatty-acyl-phospholipid synthase